MLLRLLPLLPLLLSPPLPLLMLLKRLSLQLQPLYCCCFLLPPPLSFCPCAVSDTVLVFNDLSGAHSTAVDNFACSPWIDLKAGGDVGRPGKLIRLSGYFELPLLNSIFLQVAASWYPAVCPVTGLP